MVTSRFKKLSVLMTLVALASFVSSASQLRAQSKPLALVSLKGIDALFGDAEFLLETAGVKDVAQMGLMMAQGVTEPFEKSEPIGVAVTSDGQGFHPIAFVAVKDLNQVLEMFAAQIGRPKDSGNGVLEVTKLPQPIFIKEVDGWAFITNSVAALDDIPDDPAALLAGLDQQYDIAVQALVSNIPKPLKDMAFGHINSGLQAQLARQASSGQSPNAMQQQMIQKQMQQLQQQIDEMDKLTIGLNVDSDTGSTYLDLSVTALPGTKTAEQMNAMKDTKTSLAGFLSTDAAATFNMASTIPPDQIDQAVAQLSTAETAIKDGVAKNADLPNEQAKQLVNGLIDDLLEIGEATIKSGKMDAAGALLINSRGINVIAGAHVAHGGKLEEVLRKLADAAKNDPDFPGINFNASRHAGVDFHTMDVDIPEGEDARRVFGDTLNLAVGTSDDRACLALGPGSLDALKNALDQSASSGDTAVSPVQFTIALGKILQFASTTDDDPKLAMIAQALSNTNGTDHVSLEGSTIDDGFRYRFEVEKGLLEAVGQVYKATSGASP